MRYWEAQRSREAHDLSRAGLGRREPQRRGLGRPRIPNGRMASRLNR